MPEIEHLFSMEHQQFAPKTQNYMKPLDEQRDKSEEK